jgi:hypothetical protein
MWSTTKMGGGGYIQSLDISILTARTTDITVSGYIQSNSKNY